MIEKEKVLTCVCRVVLALDALLQLRVNVSCAQRKVNHRAQSINELTWGGGGDILDNSCLFLR